MLSETLRHAGDVDPVAHLALNVASRAEFLDVDPAIVRLLEMARRRPLDDATCARVASRLARELIGDPTAAVRRSDLADEADLLARRAGDDSALADALDARMHSNWGPESADLRLALAGEIIDLARSSRDPTSERRGLLWRFATLMELRRVEDAEATRSVRTAAREHARKESNNEFPNLPHLRARLLPDSGHRGVRSQQEQDRRESNDDTPDHGRPGGSKDVR